MPTIDFPIVDSHAHLLDQERYSYGRSNGAPSLKRDCTPDDLAASAKPYEMEEFVFVEIDVDIPQYLDEADWIDGLAKRDRRVLSAVACLSLERGAAIEPEIARIAKLPAIRDVRRLIQNQPDSEYVLKPGFLEATRLLPKYNLSFDICVFHPQLPNVLRIIRVYPRGRVRPRSHWQTQNGRYRLSLARSHPRHGGAAECRLQALRTDHRGRSLDLEPRAIAPLCRSCRRALRTRPHSLGGDWPVSDLAGGYPQWLTTLDRATAGFSKADKRKLFRDNAVKAYRLNV